MEELGSKFGQRHVFGDAGTNVGDGREDEITKLQHRLVGLSIGFGETRIGKGALLGIAVFHQYEERVDATLVIAVIVVTVGADDGAVDFFGLVEQDGVVPTTCLLVHLWPNAWHCVMRIIGTPVANGMLHVVVAKKGDRVTLAEIDLIEHLEGGVIESHHAIDACLVNQTACLQLAIGGKFGQVAQFVDGA